MLVPSVSASVSDISFNPDPISINVLQGDLVDVELLITNNHTSENITLNTSYLQMLDNDDDELILTIPENITVEANSTKNITITIDADSRLDIKTYTSTITFTDINTSEEITLDFSASVSIGVCDFGQVGSSLKMDIKNPDSGDDFKPGDQIKIEVEVDNEGTENLKVQLEAYLYDEDEVIESSTSQRETLESGEDETFEFTLTIPTENRDIDEDEDYALYIKAFDDDDENNECTQDSVSINIELEKHEVTIDDSTRFLPSSAICGEEVSLIVDVINTGEKDEDVVISAENSVLNILEISDSFEIENFNSDDNEGSRTFKFQIPENTEEGIYDFRIEASYSGSTSYQTLPLEVFSCEGFTSTPGTFEVGTSSLYIKGDTVLTLDSGDTKTLHVIIENNSPEKRIYFVNLINVDDFADPVTKSVTLDGFKSTNLFIPLVSNSNVEEGIYSGTIELSDGLSTLVSQTFSAQISGSSEESKGGVSTFSGTSDTSLMVANLILILLIIGVILLIKKI